MTLSLTLKNNGFSNTLKPFQTCIVLVNKETEEYINVPFDIDLRKLGSGEKKTYTVNLPVRDLEHGSYQIYFSVKDETSGQTIMLANKNKATTYGYLLGQLEK